VRFHVPGHNYVLTTGIEVLGELGNGKQYRVNLDTGDPCFGSVTGDIVLENELPILPAKAPGTQKAEAGFCFLPSLRIGAMTIHNFPCQYEEQYRVVKGFARRTYTLSEIIIGLTALQQFAYVLCDNAHQEVEFSPRGTSFEPEDWEGWSRYPMAVERDGQNVPRLMIDIPIGSEVRHMMLDTGSAGQLLVSSTAWETLSKTLHTGEPRAVQYTLARHRPVGCQRFCVQELPMGNKTIKYAEAVVLPDGWRTGAHFAMVGMACFENDIIVLDFGRGLFWVKDQPATSK
jgi:hypothetical protein